MAIAYRQIEPGSPLHAQQQALREAVLRRPLGRVLTAEERARDPEGAHFVALMDGDVVGSVILFPYAPGEVKLRQMAIAPELQGQGVGAGLLSFAEDSARGAGVRRIRLHARATAVGFYLRAFYVEEGAPFDEDGVPHVLMVKDLQDAGRSLGLRHDLNRLVDYDPRWADEFEAERGRIAAALGDAARGIEHYGSTAVPGMRAKPILDILVGVRPLDAWRRCHDPLLALGYDYAPHAGVPGHHIFGKGRDRTERTHLLHLVELEGRSWRSNLALRDALRRDVELRQAYIAAKEAAIAEAPDGRARYNELKAAFIAAAKAGLGQRE